MERRKGQVLHLQQQRKKAGKFRMELKQRKHKNKKGQQMIIGLMFLLMTVAVFVALIPAFKELMDMAQQSDSLNCVGYAYKGNVNNSLSYNSSYTTSSMSCIVIKLYLPYIVLLVLIAGVSSLLYQKMMGGFEQQSSGYGGYQQGY